MKMMDFMVSGCGFTRQRRTFQTSHPPSTLCHGVVHEQAPEDVTEVIFHPSVTTIKNSAFSGCRSLEWVTIPDTVTRIEACAFFHCDSLRYILLSRNLEFIGVGAFDNCRSLQAVFLPLTVIHIGNEAFNGCTSLRFLYVPETIEHIGNQVVWGCNRLLTAVKYKRNNDGSINNNNVNQWLMQQCANLPFHQACSSISITPQGIVGCSQEHGINRATEVEDGQMTALHILCANPHATGDCIRAYLQLAPEAADQEDSEGINFLAKILRFVTI